MQSQSFWVQVTRLVPSSQTLVGFAVGHHGLVATPQNPLFWKDNFSDGLEFSSIPNLSSFELAHCFEPIQALLKVQVVLANLGKMTGSR